MDIRTTLVVAGLAVFCNFGWAAPAPVEAYGQRPAVVDVDMNPSGTRLAWIDDDGKSSRVIIHDILERKQMRSLLVPEGGRVRRVYWAGDDTVLVDYRVAYSLQPGKRDLTEWQRWLAVDAKGGEGRMLLMQDRQREWVTGADLIHHFTSRPGKVYMSTLDFSAAKYREEIGTRLSGKRGDSGWVENLYEVDIGNGNARALESGTPFTFDWLTNPDGDRVLRSEWNPKSDSFDVYYKQGGSWKNIYKSRDCVGLSLLAFNEDNSGAYVRGGTCDDPRRKLYLLPLDGSPLKLLVEDPTLEVEDAILDPLDRRLLGVQFGGAAQPLKWLDAQAEKRLAALKRSFKGSTVTLISRTTGYQKVVVLVESATQAPVYYLVDYTAKSAEIINERYPQLNGVTLATVREFNYTARDQYTLMGYLTVPAGAGEKNLPTVILPHGGPESRDEPGFDWLAQFLASRGYAVLQPQFRGSSGFGRAHANAGRRQWGLRMQDDVTDGVKALIEQGIADPRRVCIAGISYGGYSALAGAAFTPDLYACAVSIGGVSDLPNMLGQEMRDTGNESNSVAYWRDHIGAVTDAHVVAKSPARNVSAIRAPILLIHGNDDTIVPIAQARMMARALSGAGKKHEFVTLEGDDHHLSNSVSRVRALRELERFLAANLGSAPPAN